MGSENESALESRPPTIDDLLELCRRLNEHSVKYIVIGGMAIIHHGFVRATEDIDLLVACSTENERRLKQALLYLPDRAAEEIEEGDLEKYTVIRVADEFVIDLMRRACGIDYDEASNSIIYADIKGVSIPFANMELLWRLKQSIREKDAIDRIFLQEQMKKLKKQ